MWLLRSKVQILGLKKSLTKKWSKTKHSKLYNAIFYRKFILDVAFVVDKNDLNWILAGICREIERYVPGAAGYVDFRVCPKNARIFYYAHYHYYVHAMLNFKGLDQHSNVVLYTHKRDVGVSDEKLIELLNRASAVICMCRSDLESLLDMGLRKEIGRHVVFGADPGLFHPNFEKKGRGSKGRYTVGFCLGFRNSLHYRERKNYELVVGLIETLSRNYNVLLIGQGWRAYERFDELVSIDGFEYVEPAYSEYPDYYRKMDVFVSASRLEGGPIPLIESMMSGVVPVVSNTGFAPDVINDGENGFLFSVDADVEQVVDLVKKALFIGVDVSDVASRYSWQKLAETVLSVTQS